MFNKQEELKHYGVLGMRWGVRKDQKTGDRIFKKNSRFTRVGYSGGESPEPIDGTRKYVSNRKKDNDLWNGLLMASMMAQGAKYVHKYEYKTIKELNIASEQTMNKIYDRKFTNDKKFRDLTLKEYATIRRNMGLGYMKYENRDDFYRMLNRVGSKSVNEFYKEMKDNGYDGVTDVFGTKTFGQPVQPIILLDPEKQIVLKKDKKRRL